MDNYLKKFEKFFDYDVEIKKIIMDSAPNIEYTLEPKDLEKYSIKLEDNLKLIKYYIDSIVTEFNFPGQVLNDVNDFFKKCQISLIDNSGTYNNLARFYNDCFSTMNPQYISKLNNGQIEGYNLFINDTLNWIREAKSVNELLHFFHKYITNNSEFYEKFQKFGEGKNIALCGEKNELAQKIYCALENNTDSDMIHVISVDKARILIMARGLGHALTIEINIEGEQSIVDYFIPKICNADKVNKLKGVRKVSHDASFKTTTTGVFRVKTNDLPFEIVDFMNQVPTDKDIMSYRETVEKVV